MQPGQEEAPDESGATARVAKKEKVKPWDATRRLTAAEQQSSGVAKMMAHRLDELEDVSRDLKQCESDLHDEKVRTARLESQLTVKMKGDIFSTAGTTVGGAGVSYGLTLWSTQQDTALFLTIFFALIFGAGIWARTLK